MFKESKNVIIKNSYETQTLLHKVNSQEKFYHWQTEFY